MRRRFFPTNRVKTKELLELDLRSVKLIASIDEESTCTKSNSLKKLNVDCQKAVNDIFWGCPTSVGFRYVTFGWKTWKRYRLRKC